MSNRVDTAPCGLFEFSGSSSILYINATLSTWLKKPADEFIGQRVDVLLTVANQVFFHTHLFPLLQLHGKADEIFLSFKNVDGAAFPVVASAVRMENGHYQCAVLPVPQRRKYEDEILHAKKVAEEALKNNEELNIAKLSIENHALALEQRLRVIEQRNEELKKVSQILSHDLREPIRKIRLFADMTRENIESLGEPPESLEALGKIESEASQMSALLGTMRQYLQVDTANPLTLVDLSEILNDSIAAVTLKQSFSDWEIESETLPTIQGRRGPLLQLFSELLDNAIKFRDSARKLRVKITVQVLQQNAFEEGSNRYQFVDFVRIRIQDNGKGFAPKYGEYVFGLLKKVELSSPGLGLGLALCKKVVDSHFGTISAKPEHGIGTAIVIQLPVAGSYVVDL